MTYFYIQKLSPCCKPLLEQLLVSWQIKKFAAFYASEGPLPYSQQPVTCAYPEPDRHIRRPRIFSKFFPTI